METKTETVELVEEKQKNAWTLEQKEHLERETREEADALEDGGKLLQRENGDVVGRDHTFGRAFCHRCAREGPERAIVKSMPVGC
ncbi:hypothetical protein TNCV_3780301 [Trichonephila clavipes]|nr:hypothetical protein TNCV_3780301 [Trichonephila clavipes]